jgi:type II secretory pathway pseudopilin PulG
MHRARHSAHSPFLRPRLLIALVAAGAGLTFALWLPTRNDNASASENGRSAGQSQADHRRDHDRKHHRHPQPSASESPSESPSPTPSESPSTTAPTTAPPTTTPPTTAPTSEAPKATEWAPFTDYVAGQLVTFKGVEYQVQETHTSLPGWEPTALPALFKPVN